MDIAITLSIISLSIALIAILFSVLQSIVGSFELQTRIDEKYKELTKLYKSRQQKFFDEVKNFSKNLSNISKKSQDMDEDDAFQELKEELEKMMKPIINIGEIPELLIDFKKSKKEQLRYTIFFGILVIGSAAVIVSRYAFLAFDASYDGFMWFAIVIIALFSGGFVSSSFRRSRDLQKELDMLLHSSQFGEKAMTKSEE